MTSCFTKVEPAEHVYLVVSGRIVLELCPATIYQKNLMSVGPGEMLGWSSFVEQRNYASTGVVVTPTQLVKIDGKKLRAICDRDPEFGYDFMHRIMRALAKRLTTTWSQLANIYVPNTLPMLCRCGRVSSIASSPDATPMDGPLVTTRADLSVFARFVQSLFAAKT